MTPADIYAYTEALLRTARTVTASYAAHLCLDPDLSPERRAARLTGLRRDCEDIPEIVEVVDSIVTAHAPELCKGEQPLYRLAP